MKIFLGGWGGKISIDKNSKKRLSMHRKRNGHAQMGQV